MRRHFAPSIHAATRLKLAVCASAHTKEIRLTYITALHRITEPLGNVRSLSRGDSIQVQWYVLYRIVSCLHGYRHQRF